MRLVKSVIFSVILLAGFYFGFNNAQAQDESQATEQSQATDQPQMPDLSQIQDQEQLPTQENGIKLPPEMLQKLKSMNVSPEVVVSEMKTQIGISDAQAQRILPIMQTQMSELNTVIEKLSSDSNVSLQDLTRIQTAVVHTNSELKKILTPAQMLKWQAAMEKGREKAAEMMTQQ